MEAILISSILPTVFWTIVLLVYFSKKRLEKNCTESTIGIVVKSRLITNMNDGDLNFYRIPLIEYQINGRNYRTEIHVNQLRYFHKIPIGQITCPPIGTQIELMYNPKNINQIYAKIDDQFGKKMVMFIFSCFASFTSIFPIGFLLNEVGIRFY